MGRKNYKKLIPAVVCLSLLSCVKDKPESTTIHPSADGEKIYIACEGALGNGNASLYLYAPAKDSVYSDVYKTVNGNDLGDIFESITRIDDKLFFCINNSDKVVVLNATNWMQAAVINIPKPRYILPVSANKAYVSTLFSNKVYAIDTKTFTVKGTITMPHLNPEGMAQYFNAAYICTWDTLADKLYSIDINTDNITDSISLDGFAPQDVFIDKEQMLWVLSGNSPNGKTAMLTRIDPSSKHILKTYAFPAKANPIRPVLNNTKDTIYFIDANYSGTLENNGVYRMSIYAADLPAAPFIPAVQYQYFWALGIDPVTGNIFIGDPKGFVQKGSVSVYNTAGTKLNEFKVGVGPGHFLFDTK